MISLALAAALQTMPVPTTPTERWVHCLFIESRRLEPSGETAATITDVALSQCIRFQNELEAEQRQQIATHPDVTMRPGADRLAKDIVAQVRLEFRTMIMENIMTLRAKRATGG